MKKFLLFFAALSLSLLCAQNTEPALNLEDIVILGKSQALKDTLVPFPEIPEYTDSDKAAQNEYTPYFTRFEITEKKESSEYYNYTSQLLAGNRMNFTARLLRNSLKGNALNFNSSFIYDEPVESSARTFADITLYPAWKKLNLNFQVKYADFKQPYLENSAVTLHTNLKDFPVSDKIWLPQKVSTNVTWNLYTTSYLKTLADTYADEEKHVIDINTNSRWNKLPLQPLLEMSSTDNVFYTSLTLHTSSYIPLLHTSAFWLSADKKRIIPSVHFSKAFNLGKDYSLLFNNKPFILKNSRSELISLYSNLRADNDLLPQKSPLNAYLEIQKNRNFSLFCNCRYSYDFLSFSLADDESQLILPVQNDTWIYRFGFNARYDYKNFSFQEEAVFENFSKDLEYLSAFTSRFLTSWQKDSLLLKFIIDYKTGSCSFLENKDKIYHKDIVSLNLKLRYNINSRFTLLFNADNILNQEFRGYGPALRKAESGIVIRGGLIFSFKSSI